MTYTKPTRQRSCFLRPVAIDNASERAMVLEWLQREQIGKWLDFGEGRTTITEGQLTFLAKNPANRLNLFCDTSTLAPIGIIALQGIRNAARVGWQWGARGRYDVGSRLVSVDAVLCNLELAFGEIRLNTVQAWCVETNRPSLMVTRRAGFRDMGRQRRAHLIDGQLHDRILLDITADEFFEGEWGREVAPR